MAKAKKTAKSVKSGKKPGKRTARIAQDATAGAPTGEGVKDSKVEKKAGRPPKKTQDLLAKICEGIAIGKSSRAMCGEAKISQQTLWRWLDEDKAFSEQYARAKEMCAEVYAEETIEIADDGTGDMTLDKNGNEFVNQEVVARARLRIDARKWYASKVAPKRYGDKVVQEHQGPNGGPVQFAQVPSPDYDGIKKSLDAHAARHAR